ncbi:alpha/beta hydrolase [Terrihabitans rhizophilus]|uniref:Alpha/beta fold hydrolase n=1 Tax=Terrihabitans rhizophilus TaxID=3092662 RepID=A0ABU4RJ67_9HYPH|nr:alpha/beta fold hydrolase [Terrihabitans sp. PJ23]MDX6804876.1 alpha/beta fold hydrolase [Terrihabitans sp. PJ23]
MCLVLGGCAASETARAQLSRSESEASSEAPSFEDYRRATRAQLLRERSFQSSDTEAELSWNGPSEWRPEGRTPGGRYRKGILLVHGLGDSPWSFHDIAPELARNGFLVRTVLLPGHGTKPQDLLDVSVHDWRRVVREQAAAMLGDVDELYLGGFSTGANLVAEHAYHDPRIAGLALFSPGFKSTSLDWAAPALARVRPWLVEPDGETTSQNVVRYMTVPTNGLAQFSLSSRSARQLLESRPYDKPVFMVVAENDSVLDTRYLAKTFERAFTHPRSRLIWYGSPLARQSTRVLVRNDRLPDLRISQFSHMGVMFAPRNAMYGAEGSLRICLNGHDRSAARACEAGKDVWYSDWGYREKGKVHARLTFNPYFSWQTSIMNSVLAAPDT